MQSSNPKLHPVVRKHLEELIQEQKREGVHLLAQINAGIFDAAPFTEAKQVVSKLQERLAENIGQLSHGLSGHYSDGIIETHTAPVDVSGVVTAISARHSDRPATATLHHVTTAIAGILADYAILHTLSLASSNTILADMCLTHLQLTQRLKQATMVALPAVVDHEFAAADDGLSGLISAPAKLHMKDVFEH